MARTTSLRAQHDAAEAMIDLIFHDIAAYRSDRDAYPLTLKLARLAGILRTHFALEGEILYPTMIESDHREAAVMARVFRSDHDNLANQFERFIDRWGKSDAIAASLRQFEFEAGMLFAALRERMDRENRVLYPLAEAASTAGEPIGPEPVDARAYPREPSAAFASSTNSAMMSATGSSRLTMPTDCPAITDPPSTSPSITARRSAPAQ